MRTCNEGFSEGYEVEVGQKCIRVKVNFRIKVFKEKKENFNKIDTRKN